MEKIFQVPESISYPELAEILSIQVLETIGDEEYYKNLEKLYSISNLFNNKYDKNQFSYFSQQLVKGYLALTNQKPVV